MTTDGLLRLAHRIAGYVPNTDMFVECFDVPPSSLKLVRRLAQVDADDPNALGSYAIAPADLAHLAAILNCSRLNPHNDYFLEAFVISEHLTAIRRCFSARSDAELP